MTKTILVTGGSGHIGSTLVEKVVGLYPTVYVLSRRRNDSWNDSTIFLQCSLSDISEYKDILKHIDVVVHLAAFVPKMKDDDFKQSVEVNLKGTMKLVRLLKQGTRFVFISTCEVYGVPETEVIDENHSLNPLTYYGMSKIAAEKTLQIYCKKHNIDLIILRLTSVYGPGEVINRAIPNFIRNVMNDKSPVVFGDGQDKRDYVYVDDVVGYILAAVRLGHGIYNIAMGRSYSIQSIANMIIELSGKDLQIVYKDREAPRRDYVFDVTRAKSLGYVPKVELEEGLRKEIDWYEEENIS